MQRKKIFFKRRLALQIPQNHPINLGRKNHWKRVENAGKTVSKNQRHKKMLRHSLGITFEFYEIPLSSIFQMLGEKALDKLEKSQNPNDFKIFKNLEGLDTLENWFLPRVRQKIKGKWRDKIDEKPTLQIPAGNLASWDHKRPFFVSIRNVEIKNNIQNEKRRSHILIQFKK